MSGLEAFVNAVVRTVDAPVTWFKERVVSPNQKKYAWYHQQFRRVPTVDQCYTDDVVCDFEANVQYKRDRQVDTEILTILKKRFEDCAIYEAPEKETCRGLLLQYKDAEENWFIKYGDLGFYADARNVYMKQKHRMLWERRHGPVGTGMKPDL